MSRSPLLILTGAYLIHSSHALSFSFSASSKDQASNGTVDFQNVNNISTGEAIYTTDVDLGGQKLSVQLDTGSSDLWLDTAGVDLSSFTNTGINSTISYLDGSAATGYVLIGNISVGSFTAAQAFISAPGSNATVYNDKGILGVGPPLLSQINRALNGSAYDGNMFLQNVFEDDSSLQEFISFQLSRSETTGSTAGGIFTIGEIASNLTAISNNPQLDVFSSLGRWTVFMDGMVVNGKNLSGHSAFNDSGIPGLGAEQTLANLDTGTGLAAVPKTYADAIYSSVPGAHFDKDSGLYNVPCDAKINVSFVFGGVGYSVHPIDTVQVGTDVDGSTACFSGFITRQVDPNEETQDFILGGTFMRNVYAVFNFGNFTGGNSAPTIQLLSTTDADQAYSQFNSLSAQRNQSLDNADVKSSSASRSSSLLTSIPFGTCVSVITLVVLSGVMVL